MKLNPLSTISREKNGTVLQNTYHVKQWYSNRLGFLALFPYQNQKNLITNKKFRLGYTSKNILEKKFSDGWRNRGSTDPFFY